MIEILMLPFKWKLLSSTFLWCCLLCCTRWFFKSVAEILKFDHSNESACLSSTFLWCCLLCWMRWFLLLSLLWVKSSSLTIQIKAIEQYFPVLLFIMLYKAVLTSESVGEILKCDHSNESYRGVLSFGALCLSWNLCFSVVSILDCFWSWIV